MAGTLGKGWEGWGWGAAKDTCGLCSSQNDREPHVLKNITRRIRNLFLHIRSDATRCHTFTSLRARYGRAAIRERREVGCYASLSTSHSWRYTVCSSSRVVSKHQSHFRSVAGGVVAGLAYELIARPFDIARRTVHHSHLVTTSSASSVVAVLKVKIHEEGFMALFRGAETASDLHARQGSRTKRNINSMLRLLARVGPWGVGFLIFEAFGPGLS